MGLLELVLILAILSLAWVLRRAYLVTLSTVPTAAAASVNKFHSREKIR